MVSFLKKSIRYDLSKIFTFSSISLNSTPIIDTTISLHATYLNPYDSDLQGFLFFYVNGATSDNDIDDVVFTNFNTTTGLYYADFDALAGDFALWLKDNQPALALKYVYNV